MSISLFVGILFAGILAFCAWKILSLVQTVEDMRRTPTIDPALLTLLHQRLDTMAQDMKSTMMATNAEQRQAGQYMTQTVRDVTERLVKIEETNKQVLSFSGQLDQLQKILTNPKQRGILGEYYLETLLKNVFAPDQYHMQYGFKNGDIVDAAIFLQDKIVPIDSKFSLENYNRLSQATTDAERELLEKTFVNDLKTRIQETAKYIRPEEGTMDFAFMFIPHEAIYYDLLINKIGAVAADTENLLQRAATKYHVIIVSPTSFTAYLQTVVQGLRALKIEEQAKEIRQRITELQRHMSSYDQYFAAVGKHLGTAVNQYNLASKEFGKIDKDVLKITGTGIGHETLTLDKPTTE